MLIKIFREEHAPPIFFHSLSPAMTDGIDPMPISVLRNKFSRKGADSRCGRECASGHCRWLYGNVLPSYHLVL